MISTVDMLHLDEHRLNSLCSLNTGSIPPALEGALFSLGFLVEDPSADVTVRSKTELISTS